METEEITLVQILDGEELCTNKSKAFEDYNEAKNYFTDILKEFGITDKETIEDCVSDGYFEDTTHFAVELKLIVYYKQN